MEIVAYIIQVGPVETGEAEQDVMREAGSWSGQGP